MIRCTSLLALAGAAGFCGAAQASFDGLSTALVAQPTIDGVNYDVYRVYVSATNPTDTVEVVSGNAANPVLIAGGGLTGLYQNLEYGGDIEPNNFLFAVDADLEWDTFVTIGTPILPGTPPGSEPGPTQLLGFGAPGFECDRLTLVNGGWYRLPGNPLTVVGADLELLIGQFTVPRGAVLSGSLRVVGLFDGTREQVLADLPLPLCPADVTGDRQIDVDDLIAAILGWGTCAGSECPCPDIIRDGVVDVDDLLAILLGWGACD